MKNCLEVDLANYSEKESTLYVWNIHFQKAVEAVNDLSIHDPFETRLKAFLRLGQLYQNFIDTATLYGKIIISERFLPDDAKTIKPVDLGMNHYEFQLILKDSLFRWGLLSNRKKQKKLVFIFLNDLLFISSLLEDKNISIKEYYSRFVSSKTAVN